MKPYFRPLTLTAVALLMIGSSQATAQEPSAFDLAPYRKQCGGQVMANCEKPELNQQTIFKAAQRLAETSGRRLVVIFDENPAIGMERIGIEIKLDPVAQREFNRRYVLVPISSKLTSGLAVARSLGANVEWTPTVLVLASSGATAAAAAAKPPVYHIPITNPFSGASFLAQIDVTLASGGRFNQADFPVSDIERPDGQVTTRKLLQTPVALTNIQPAVVGLTGGGATEADVAYRFGLWSLYVYQYADAVRALGTTIKQRPNDLLLRATMSFAAAELGDASLAAGHLERAIALVKTSAPSPLLRSFIDYLNITLGDLMNNSTLSALRDVVRKEIGTETSPEIKMLILQSGLLPSREASGHAKEILAEFPDHVGAHHKLIHIDESLNLYPSALKHAAALIQLAPTSAHALHMYGHVLPKVGRWTEAISYFEQADAIHQQWASRYSAEPTEDWHYQHNLDLLAHAYSWMGQLDKAEATWKRRCDSSPDMRLCTSYINHLVAVGQRGNAMALAKQAMERAEINIGQLLLTTGISRLIDRQARGLEIVASAARTNPAILVAVKILIQQQTSEAEREAVSNYVASIVSKPVFDSWSHGVQQANLLIALAQAYGHKDIAANIRLIVASVGFTCKAETK